MTNSVETYQINKLPVDLAEMATTYSDTLEAAGRMGYTFVPLSILSTLQKMPIASAEVDEVIGAAKDSLPNNSDSDRAEAVLNGALALNRQQSERIDELIGMVLWYMQQYTPTAATASADEVPLRAPNGATGPVVFLVKPTVPEPVVG